ncbi:MAG TPA: hypothetical protein VNI83_00510 [Vicinamibacterales bacterium]|nr:hypothetical protein [Vicinamibacterales bacterium]
MSSPIRLKAALATRGHTLPLKDGTVKTDPFALEFEEVPTIVQAFRRMVRGLEFDVSEMAITTYLCARAHGKPFTAIPVFPMRGLHHGAVVHNVRAGLRSPKDLEGRRVGVNRGYTVTTGVWARAILQHEHGVDLRRVTWVLSGDEHVAEYRPPANVVPLDRGRSLEDLLAAGELPAAVGVSVDAPDVRPLIPDAEQAGFAALRDRGWYPINHTVVIRNDRLAAHPDLARRLFDAFVEAKRLYLERLAGGRLAPASKEDELLRRVMEIAGDPLPYGVEPNRRMLEAIVRHAVEQEILARPFAVEDLFPKDTLELTG